MAIGILVEEDLRQGERLVVELERRGLEVRGALWHYDAEADAYELMLEVPTREDASRGDLYQALVDALKDIGRMDWLLSVTLREPGTPLFKDLSARYAQRTHSGHLRLHNVYAAGELLKNAVVYRLPGWGDDAAATG